MNIDISLQKFLGIKQYWNMKSSEWLMKKDKH